MMAKAMADRLLDTGILIRHLRMRNSVKEFLMQWGRRDNLYISVVTRAEILAGMRPREEQVTLELLNALNGIDIDQRIADRAGRMIYTLARGGIQLSFPDALIAGTALEYGLSVVTTNISHFESAGVQIEKWSGA